MSPHASKKRTHSTHSSSESSAESTSENESDDDESDYQEVPDSDDAISDVRSDEEENREKTKQQHLTASRASFKVSETPTKDATVPGINIRFKYYWQNICSEKPQKSLKKAKKQVGFSRF